MSRLDAAMLNQITSTAEHWRRQCNGQPPHGLPVNRAGLRAILAMSAAVAVRPDGVITWRAEGRVFTAEPVRDDAGN